jgi:TrmH family RNA methyltransferase
MQRITSRSHPLVVRARAIARGRDPGLLLDGVHLVAEALAANRAVESAIVAAADATRTDLRTLLAKLARANVPIFTATAPVMEAVSPVKTPSPIVALTTRPVWTVETVFARRPPLVVIASGVQDPGNVGAIVRVAEAAGASGVLVSGTSADPFGWKAVRGSMGSVLRVPIRALATPLDAIAEARRHGCRVVASVAHRGRSLFDVDLTGPLAVLVGGEGAGLDPAIISAADERVTVPMQPPVESLDAAAATAVILYEARRQRTGS